MSIKFAHAHSNFRFGNLIMLDNIRLTINHFTVNCRTVNGKLFTTNYCKNLKTYLNK